MRAGKTRMQPLNRASEAVSVMLTSVSHSILVISHSCGDGAGAALASCRNGGSVRYMAGHGHTISKAQARMKGEGLGLNIAPEQRKEGQVPVFLSPPPPPARK